MIQIYSPDNRNYEKNGDMTLFPTLAIVHPILNDAWEATLEHPIDDDGRWKYLEEKAVVKMPSFNGDQLFRIQNIIKTDSGVTCTMEPVFYDSIGDCILEDVRPTGKNGQQALDIMTAPNTKYKGKSNITKAATAYYQYKNLMEAINGDIDNSFVKRWGGEILYDNFTIIINDRVGGDYGVELRYGKNIPQDGLEEEIDTREVVTRIYPRAFNGRMMTTGYVDSPLANTYPTIMAAVVKFEDVKMREDLQDGDEEEGVTICDTQEELNKVLKQRCEEQFKLGLDKPKVTITADMVVLKGTDLYKDYEVLEDVSLGDTVHCRHSRLGIITDARVIELEYDSIRKKPATVVLGDFQYNYFSHVSSAVEKIDSVVRPDGSLVAERVAGFLDAAQTSLRAQYNVAKKQDILAALFENLDEESPMYGALGIGTQGIMISKRRTEDGKSWEWTTAMTANGLVADIIVAGTISDKLGRNFWNLDNGDFHLSSEAFYIDQVPASDYFKELANNMTMSLSNDYQAISVDSEGNYGEFPAGVETSPTVLYGTKDITTKCVYTVTHSDTITGTWDRDNRVFTVTGLTADSGWVEIKATYLSSLHVRKRFTVAKLYGGAEGEPGAPGQNGRTYIMETNANVVKIGKDNLHTPSVINVNAYYRDGISAARKTYAGRFRVRETADGKTWRTIYQSAADESSLKHMLYTIVTDASGVAVVDANGVAVSGTRDISDIEITLYAAGGTSQVIDVQRISVVRDIAALTHYDVINLMTKGGTIKGIFEDGGELYINATYIMTGELSDKLGRNYWNLETGELRMSPSVTIGGKTVQEISKGEAISAVDGQTQKDIFNKLTENGKRKGLFITAEGEIYFNASYINTGVMSANLIKAGVLQDKNGNVVINMETGTATIKKGSINLGGNFIASSEGSVTIKKGSIAIGTFSVNTGGTVAITKGQINLGNGNFVVTDEGKVTIYEGSINIGGAKFIVTSEEKVTIKEGSINLGNNFIANTDGTVTVKKGSISLGGNFAVNSEGEVTVKRGSINLGNGNFIADTTGTVTMKKGVIGNWTISRNDLVGEYYTSSTMQAYQMRLSPSRGGGISWNENSKITVNDGGDIVTYYGLVVNLRGYSDFGDGSGMFQLNGLGPSSSGGALVLKGSTVYYASSSSRRYKNYVSDMSLEDAKRALDIPVVWFEYIRGYLQNSDPLCGKPIPGFFAEDVYDAIPEAAMLEDGKVEDWNYRVLIPIMMKLIQNLYQKENEK